MFKSLSHHYVYLIVATVNLAGFLTGTTLSWSSPVFPKLTSDDMSDNPFERKISDNESSLIASLPNLGGVFGPLLYIYILDKVGRKKSVLLIGVPFLVGYLTLAFATNINLFYFARFVCGISIGSTTAILSIYIGEIAEDNERGLLLTTTTACIIIGILFCYTVGPYVSIMVFNLILAFIAVLFIIGVIVFALETPHYFLTIKKESDAREILRKLKPNSDIEKELLEIHESVKLTENVSLFEIFKTKAGIKAFYICSILQAFQQFSGISVILSYTQTIFEATGSTMDSAISSIIVGVVQMITSAITPIFSDKIGRRFLLLLSIVGCTIMLAIFGIYFQLKEDSVDVSNLSWLPILALVLFITFFNCGFGPLPSVAVGELFPLNVKSVGANVSNSVYYLVGYIITFAFASILDAIHMGGVFFLFSGASACAAVFVYFCFIETKGKSMQEIQDVLNK